MPDTFSTDFACLQISPFETVILYNFQDIHQNSIGKHAQVKHFPNDSAKHSRFTMIKRLNLSIKSQAFLTGRLSCVGVALEHRTGNRKVTGSNTVEVLIFLSLFFILFFSFQASLRNCINCVHCDDHFFIFISFPQFIYDLFHISLTLISFTGTYEPTIDLLPTSVASQLSWQSIAPVQRGHGFKPR